VPATLEPGTTSAVEGKDLAEAHAKGSLLVHLRERVVERHGDVAWSAIVGKLSPAEGQLLSGLLVSAAWYPVGPWNRALAAHLGKHAATDPAAETRALAVRIADRDLHTVLKLTLKLASPEAILRRVGWLWGRYFDTGTMDAHEVDPRVWHVRLDAPSGEDEGAGQPTCAYGVSGWLTHALRLAGAARASVRHVGCRFSVEGVCEYEATW
jgi:hypothetical protein